MYCVIELFYRLNRYGSYIELENPTAGTWSVGAAASVFALSV